MLPLTQFCGIVAPLDRGNIDTDAILPKQFLKLITKAGYGNYLFYDWRFLDNGEENPDFVLNHPEYKKATVLLTRENFGCGSSREHAPWAISDYGFRVIIAPSFADIFYNNCFKNGILPIRLPEKDVDTLFQNIKSKKQYTISVNLTEKLLFDNEHYLTTFEVNDYHRGMLMKGLDEIGSTLQKVEKISMYEKNNQIFYHL